jgi:hypothetical protein
MPNLIPTDHLKCKLDHLMAFKLEFTQMERKLSSDPICELGGPIIDQDCRYICKSCKETVIRGRIYKFALACGLWLGKVPNELQDLTANELQPNELQLKLNHRDYADLEISHKNLESYPEDSPPVVINYRHSVTNKIPEATSVHDIELENGTEEGACPFTVHTLTSEEYDTMNSETLKAMAAKHLDDGGKVLAIGHSKELQFMWKNPKLALKCFYGFSLMVWMALVMKDRDIYCLMQSTSDKYSTTSGFILVLPQL